MFVGLRGSEVGADMGGISLCWERGEGGDFRMTRSSGLISVGVCDVNLVFMMSIFVFLSKSV